MEILFDILFVHMKRLIFLFFLLFLVPFSALAADTAGPTVGSVAPLSAVYNVPQTFYVTATDPSGVASCTLVVSSIYQTLMVYNAAHTRWEVSYTFTTIRSANSIRAVCTDTLGNKTTGKGRVIPVTESPIIVPDGSSETTSTGSAEIDATGWDREAIVAASPVLIKTACPGGEDFTHPCRTVYFLDAYGKRHAFTHEKAYFSWYSDWSNIHIVSQAHMVAFPLGNNVRYKPGVKLVKFPSVNTVYAVSRGGLLRPIASEAVARALYGNNWNQQVDDISESFYSNYTVATDSPIADVSHYNVASERTSVQSINDNIENPLQM